MSSSDVEPEPIPLGFCLVPLGVLVAGLVGVLVVVPRLEPGFEGSGHVPLVLAAAAAALVARRFGHDIARIERGLAEGVSAGLPAIFVLMTIGMLMGTWLASGTVQALIYWGLGLLSPRVFLAATCLVCSLVSLVSGSSWSTAGTIGLALVGVGDALGIDPAMTAGAVVSGAYFGDKLSPLSDTTNLAPAVAGADLFVHIRHMLWTTVPSWVLALGLYTALGFGLAEGPVHDVAPLRAALDTHFGPGPLHLVPPGVVALLIARRHRPLPALLAGVLAGAVVALAQGVSVGTVVTAATSGYVSTTGVGELDALLSRGGMLSLGSTVFLIVCALAFGGVLEATGMLEVLAAALLRRARTTGRLVAATVASAFGMNVVAADQYISIVVPGRMLAPAYRARGLAPQNLSRALEDGGTITSPLVPWNTCGAFMAATLMVPTFAYAPYAFLNLLNPLLSILYGITGFSMVPAAAEASTDEGERGAGAGGGRGLHGPSDDGQR
ncbi:MAG: Na+/H+ antiporter NhaC [Deltaproteobacteria bacterium]|nr:MAG: Na+/H+ antiporter NhaC [Deltaproteobacteria bacterium]